MGIPNPTLDVHIALIDSVSKEWVNQCIESVNIAAKNAEYEVNVHIFDGIVDHIGKARQLGYSFGSANYMTYVDCDDYILPNAFSCLHDSLKVGADLITTGEMRLQNGHFTELTTGLFHLMVYKRDILINFDFEQYPTMVDVETKNLATVKGNTVINIPLCVYVHRMYWESGSRILSRKLRRMEMKNEQSA